MISLKINVSAIEKERLFKGAKGTYLDAILIPTPDGQYGDYMIVQSVSKEEREAGVKGPILGNAKNVGGGQRSGAPQQRRSGGFGSRRPSSNEAGYDSDVPF